MMPRSWPVIVFAWMLAGCGPDKGGGGSSGTGEGSASSGTSATGVSTSESVTTGALSCDAYVSHLDDVGPAVEITLRNPGTEPVWVGAVGCGGLPLVAIRDESQQDIHYYGSNCSPELCQDFLGLSDCQQACDNCAAATARRLGPGASLTMNWPGTRAETVLMTAECAPGVGCQRDCVVGSKAAPGLYNVEVMTFQSCTGDCDCDPMGTDSCALWGAPALGEAVDVVVPLMYPEVTALELELGAP